MHPYQNVFGKKLTFGERMAIFWVNMGFCGISPIGPGTVGTLLGAALFVLLYPMPANVLATVIVLSFFMSLLAIEYLQKRRTDVQDASWIVIDEGVGIWIALMAWDGTWAMLIASVVLFRILDIAKPFPISYMDQKGHSGFWVMADDVAAGVFAWAILWMADALRVFL